MLGNLGATATQHFVESPWFPQQVASIGIVEKILHYGGKNMMNCIQYITLHSAQESKCTYSDKQADLRKKHKYEQLTQEDFPKSRDEN